MKKVLEIMTSLLAVAVLLSACARNQSDSEVAAQRITRADVEIAGNEVVRDDEIIEPLTEEYLRSLPETSQDDFRFGERQDGLYVNGYNGSEKIVVIPANCNGVEVVGIASYSFAENDSLCAVVLPDSVKVVETGAFGGSRNLETVVLSEQLSVIDDYAFLQCEALKCVTFAPNLIEIGACAFTATKITEIELSATLTEISPSAFYDVDHPTIISESGSYAQTFAEENGIEFRVK